MYSLLLETYIKDSMEKHRLFNAIESIPCVSRKAKWPGIGYTGTCTFFFCIPGISKDGTSLGLECFVIANEGNYISCVVGPVCLELCRRAISMKRKSHMQ